MSAGNMSGWDMCAGDVSGGDINTGDVSGGDINTGDAVGYGKPPKSTRFQKGRSGNPKGRPRGRKREPPYEVVLGQMVTIREDGVERCVTAAEAFLLQLTRQGLQSGGPAARYASSAIEAAREERFGGQGDDPPPMIRIFCRSPGSVVPALEPLRMARKLDRYRETARMVLEPWIVEAALARLGDRRLSFEEQRTVLKATRTPKKVRWPAWWQARPDTD